MTPTPTAVRPVTADTLRDAARILRERGHIRGQLILKEERAFGLPSGVCMIGAVGVARGISDEALDSGTEAIIDAFDLPTPEDRDIARKDLFRAILTDPAHDAITATIHAEYPQLFSKAAHGVLYGVHDWNVPWRFNDARQVTSDGVEHVLETAANRMEST